MSTRSETAEEELVNPNFQALPVMTDWEREMQEQETWDSFPSYPTPTMQHAAHPVIAEVPPGYDGTASWFKYSDAVERWCDLTKVEAEQRGPAIATLLSGRAELFKERLDRDRLRDPETGVESARISSSASRGKLLSKPHS